MFAFRTLPVRCVASYLRRCRWGFARWRLIDYALRNTKKYGPLMSACRVTTGHGFAMRLNLRDWTDQHIYATGTYEASTAATIEALAGEGDFCIDIGANVGFFTLLMARRVGSAGAVWAFEPCPDTRRRLLANVELNRLTNVTVREEAVSADDGSGTLYGGPDDHSGIASLRPIPSSGASYQVRTCRLSSLLEPARAPRLIKMDIEGAEYLALSGMTDLLREWHPDLVIEMSNHFLAEMGSSSPEVYDLLTGLGYRMYAIDWDGLVACREWDPSLPTQFNALFTARPKLPDRLPWKSV